MSLGAWTVRVTCTAIFHGPLAEGSFGQQSAGRFAPTGYRREQQCALTIVDQPPLKGQSAQWRSALGYPYGQTATKREQLMPEEFKEGDKVVWSSHGQDDTPGVVKRKITSETTAGGRKVKASESEPQYLVRSEKGGGEAVHKPSALKRR